MALAVEQDATSLSGRTLGRALTLKGTTAVEAVTRLTAAAAVVVVQVRQARTALVALPLLSEEARAATV